MVQLPSLPYPVPWKVFDFCFVFEASLHRKVEQITGIGNLLNLQSFPLLGESASQLSNTALVFPGTRPCPEATYELAATSQLISILKVLSL